MVILSQLGSVETAWSLYWVDVRWWRLCPLGPAWGWYFPTLQATVNQCFPFIQLTLHIVDVQQCIVWSKSVLVYFWKSQFMFFFFLAYSCIYWYLFEASNHKGSCRFFSSLLRTQCMMGNTRLSSWWKEVWSEVFFMFNCNYMILFDLLKISMLMNVLWLMKSCLIQRSKAGCDQYKVPEASCHSCRRPSVNWMPLCLMTQLNYNWVFLQLAAHCFLLSLVLTSACLGLNLTCNRTCLSFESCCRVTLTSNCYSDWLYISFSVWAVGS